ncbi:MAG: response regulator [Ignavibacteriales bacterium]|nr:response regulator [Ignavibacteriales bacterium]
MAELTPRDDAKKTVSEILKRVDQLIKNKSFEQADLELKRAKEIDPKNIYIFAYEERLSVLEAEFKKAQELEEQKKRQEAEEQKKLEEQRARAKAEEERRKKELLERQAQEERRKKIEEEARKREEEELRKAEERVKQEEAAKVKEKKSQKLDEKMESKIEQRVLARLREELNKPKVMIIDDDEKLLTLFKETIEDGGYHVDAFTTSDEAYKHLREDIPDLILCDINLETSTMGGFTFFEKVRELDQLSDVPFIFLSGLTDEVLVRTGKELGVDDYLTKPISEKALLATIKGKIKRFGQLKKSRKET